MGTISDLRIEQWQKRAGIEPANGERLAMLLKTQKSAFELICIIELEISGIRDGDGCWHGCDALTNTLVEIASAIEPLADAWPDPRKKSDTQTTNHEETETTGRKLFPTTPF